MKFEKEPLGLLGPRGRNGFRLQKLRGRVRLLRGFEGACRNAEALFLADFLDPDAVEKSGTLQSAANLGELVLQHRTDRKTRRLVDGDVRGGEYGSVGNVHAEFARRLGYGFFGFRTLDRHLGAPLARDDHRLPVRELPSFGRTLGRHGARYGGFALRVEPGARSGGRDRQKSDEKVGRLAHVVVFVPDATARAASP